MWSGKISRENDDRKVLRMMLEHFRPWKGNKFKFKEVPPKEENIDNTDKSDCASVTSSSTYKGMEEESGIYGSTSDLSSIRNYDLGNCDERSIWLEEEVEKLKRQIEVKEIVSTIEKKHLQQIDKHKDEIFKKIDDGYEAMEDLIRVVSDIPNVISETNQRSQWERDFQEIQHNLTENEWSEIHNSLHTEEDKLCFIRKYLTYRKLDYLEDSNEHIAWIKMNYEEKIQKTQKYVNHLK